MHNILEKITNNYNYNESNGDYMRDYLIISKDVCHELTRYHNDLCKIDEHDNLISIKHNVTYGNRSHYVILNVAIISGQLNFIEVI